MTVPDVGAAQQFLAANARVLDRRRFERLFLDGPAAPVRDAVAAYRNLDGGFGHALEPDGRDPASQPAAVELALRVLHEADVWDLEVITAACDWLAVGAPPEGGALGVAPTIHGWPHAPWWVPQEDNPASLVTTGLIAGTLHARGTVHPWLERATKLMWSRIDTLDTPNAYEMRGVLRFLQYVPDRERAERAFQRVGPMLFDRDLVTLDPNAPGEVHGPLDFAPEPGDLARRLFDEATISAHLDHLAAAQRDDGGWMFNWLAWSPAVEREWRGHVTIEALRVLRTHDRL